MRPNRASSGACGTRSAVKLVADGDDICLAIFLTLATDWAWYEGSSGIAKRREKGGEVGRGRGQDGNKKTVGRCDVFLIPNVPPI